MISVTGKEIHMGTVRRGWLSRSVQRQDGKCYYCQTPFSYTALANPEYLRKYRRYLPTTDHIVPLVEDGADVEENTVAACFLCNHLKGNTMPWDFIALLRAGAFGEVYPQFVPHKEGIEDGNQRTMADGLAAVDEDEAVSNVRDVVQAARHQLG